MPDDLVTWLRAQIDEDERVAREASGDMWVTGASQGYEYSRPGDVYAIAPNGTPARIAQGTRCGPDISAEQSSAHIARHDPARVLAEVAAKRAIIDRHDPGHGLYCAECRRDLVNSNLMARWPCWHMRVLALPYANRDGYREEWRP